MSSPRARRLAADYQAVSKLCRESSILDLSCSGDPPNTYILTFAGAGLALDPQSGPFSQNTHEVRVRLGSNYPRSIPELHWLTPIFHPNISANGLVCLGGYTTNWVPSLKLDDLCIMLWDMIRYRNFDTTSPYNRMAAEWAKNQRQFILPLDQRPLRDRPILHTDPSPVPPPPPGPVAPSPLAFPTPPPIQSSETDSRPAEELGLVEVEEIEDPDLIPSDFVEVIEQDPSQIVPTGRLVTPPVPPRNSNSTSSTQDDDPGITFL